MEMLFVDCIHDEANYILIFEIKLIQHVNNSSLYIDACAHRNNACLVEIQSQLVQQQSKPHTYANRWYYNLDGLIWRHRVLALMVWGRFYSPYNSNQRWWSYDETGGEGSRFDVVVERQPHLVDSRSQMCKPFMRHLFITILVPFHHRHAPFYTISWLILRK